MITKCKVCGSKLEVEQISRTYHIYIHFCNNKNCLGYECEGSLSRIWVEKFFTENYIIEEQNRGSSLFHQLVIYLSYDEFYEKDPIILSPPPITFKYKKKINLKDLDNWIKKHICLF